MTTFLILLACAAVATTAAAQPVYKCTLNGKVSYGERLRAARAADVQRKKCERLRLKRQWAEEDAARAGGQHAQAARLKAKPQGEALAVECPG